MCLMYVNVRCICVSTYHVCVKIVHSNNVIIKIIIIWSFIINKDKKLNVL